MKKQMKKLTSSLMVLAMLVMSLSTIVNAEDTDPDIVYGSLIIENTIADTAVTLENKVFEAYEIFNYHITGIDADGTIVDDVTLEYDVQDTFEAFFLEVLGDEFGESDRDDNTFNAAAIEYVESRKADIDDFAEELMNWIDEEGIEAAYDTSNKETTTSSIVTSGGVETLTISDMEAGYYLVMDATTGDSTNAIMSSALVTVPNITTVGEGDDAQYVYNESVKIQIKASQPTIDKEVMHNELETWGDVSDYEIGDLVDYRITVTLPTDITGYESYTYIVEDYLPEGIELYREGTINEDVLLYFDEGLTQQVGGSYHSLTTGDESTDYDWRLSLEIMAINADPAVAGTKTIYIAFQGVLTEDADIFNEGTNTNTASLTYSNNPYDEKSTNTIKDEVDTYTFGIDILKTRGDEVTPLAGATFTLQSNDGEGSNYTSIYLKYLGGSVDDKEDTSEYTVPTYAVSEGTVNAEDSEGVVVTDSNGEFNIIGLDDETSYKLIEAIAPTGYNIADPIDFTLHMDYETKSLTVDSITGMSASNNIVSATIVNTSNALLPATGGIGTTIFMIVGGVMMLGACVVLVAKRKKS